MMSRSNLHVISLVIRWAARVVGTLLAALFIFMFAGYALAGILALYCSILSGLILFEHLLFMLILHRKEFWKFAGSGLVILLAYLPWLLMILNSYPEVVSSLAWHKMPEKMPFCKHKTGRSGNFLQGNEMQVENNRAHKETL